MYIIEHESFPLREGVSYEEELIRILAHDVKQLQNKVIPLVKALWKNHRDDEAIWENEDDMGKRRINNFW